QLEERRLPRAVRTDHRTERSDRQGDVDAIDDKLSLAREGQPARTERVLPGRGQSVADVGGRVCRRHRILLAFSNSTANTGAPTTAVRIPTGNSRGSNRVRAPVSIQIRKMAPASADRGSTTRFRCPATSRTACGRISPTKPIEPETETIAPVSNA